MTKSNMYLTDLQRETLQKLADGFGITRSEYIRRVLDEHITKMAKKAWHVKVK